MATILNQYRSCATPSGGVFLEKAVIPYLDMADEMKTPLNAYLYDFYISGSTKALVEANKIPRGDVWFLLREFTMVLATIITSFENFLSGSNEDADWVQDDITAEDESVAADLDRTESQPDTSLGKASIDDESDRHTLNTDSGLASDSATTRSRGDASHGGCHTSDPMKTRLVEFDLPSRILRRLQCLSARRRRRYLTVGMMRQMSSMQ